MRAAVAHYQFETIHPFADGNGRLGRVLVSLELIKKGVLRYPVLYLSGYLLKERSQYDNLLLKVTTEEDWTSWIIFFLKGIKEQAMHSEEIVDKISDLYETARVKARQKISSPNIEGVVTLIFTKRTVSTLDVMKTTKVRHTSAMALLRKLSDIGILTNQNPEAKRNIHFTNEPLIKLLESL